MWPRVTMISPLQDLSSLLVECARKILYRVRVILNYLIDLPKPVPRLLGESAVTAQLTHARAGNAEQFKIPVWAGRLRLRVILIAVMLASLKCTQYSLSARAARALAHGPTAYGSPLPPYPQ